MSLPENEERLIEKIKEALDDPGTSAEMASELREEWSIIISGCWLEHEEVAREQELP